MLRLLSQMLEGLVPDVSDVLLLRSALLRAADVYQPLNMGQAIEAEVADVSTAVF